MEVHRYCRDDRLSPEKTWDVKIFITLTSLLLKKKSFHILSYFSLLVSPYFTLLSLPPSISFTYSFVNICLSFYSFRSPLSLFSRSFRFIVLFLSLSSFSSILKYIYLFFSLLSPSCVFSDLSLYFPLSLYLSLLYMFLFLYIFLLRCLFFLPSLYYIYLFFSLHISLVLFLLPSSFLSFFSPFPVAPSLFVTDNRKYLCLIAHIVPSCHFWEMCQGRFYRIEARKSSTCQRLLSLSFSLVLLVACEGDSSRGSTAPRFTGDVHWF